MTPIADWGGKKNFAPSAFTSTAITISAPSARAAAEGIMATSPPSTSCRPCWSETGRYQPGIAQLARTANGRSPLSRITTPWSLPVSDQQGRHLVDGGLVAMIPSAAARALGADIVIAVDVNAEGAKFFLPPQSAIGVILQSMLVVQRTVSWHQLQDADLVVSPLVGHIRWDELGRADELIAAGYEAGMKSSEAIHGLIASVAAAKPKKWYQFRRRNRTELKGRRPVIGRN